MLRQSYNFVKYAFIVFAYNTQKDFLSGVRLMFFLISLPPSMDLLAQS